MTCGTILIVEDNELLRLELATYLKRQGFSVVQASNGADGIEVALKRAPDLVVTDLMMPELDGIEQIVRLRAALPSVKVIAISGGGRTRNLDPLKLASSIGADAVFAKPVNMIDLRKAIETCLGNQARDVS
jgi:DNA-binding response OmpR family regulator